MTLRRIALLCTIGFGLLTPRIALGVPWYLWQFAEWREHDLTGGLKLVPEPFHDRKGGYVLDIWDLLGPTVFGYPATLSVAGYNEGNTFFATARSPLQGGVTGNTVGGDAFIQVQKRYHKDSDVSALRFTYSSAFLEVMDFGSGAPPWKAPYAQITMEVDVFQDGVGYVWGLTQTALARSDAGIDLRDLADDIWVLDVTGETRGPRAQVVDRTPRWQWNCETCGEPAYGYHQPKLQAPYTQDVDLSAVPRGARVTLYFALTVRAVDPSQGETAAYAFARDPLSGEELTDDGVRFEADGLTELGITACDQPGFPGVACLLTGLPPASCADGELPEAFDRKVVQARDLVEKALVETSAKKLRKLVKSIGSKLEKADRAITKREGAKRGPKPSPSCAADAHDVLGSALELLDTAVCDPASGSLVFDAPAYQTSEDAGGVTLRIARTGGSAGTITATVSGSRGIAGATPGVDYLGLPAAVTFADGDTGPRDVVVPIVDDRSGEPDEDVSLELATSGGCASGSSTILTILDDDHADDPTPETFAVAGTVTGLVGAGLVLEEVRTGARVTPGNGPFVFGARFLDGEVYDVRVATQPANPAQICTLTNRTGTIAAADVTDVTVVCETPPPTGALDPSFGNAGRVTGAPAGGARAVAVQGDGKLLVLGSGTLTRFDGDGTIDTTFATNGVAPVAFAGGLSVEAQDVAVQPDGRIVVVGYTGVRFGSQTDFAVSRYTADGSLDPTFGAGGTVITDWAGVTDRAYAVLVQGDGKIVVAGHAGTVNGSDYAVARYTGDGTLDASFGSGGKVSTNVAGQTDLGYAAALQPDGRIVVAGRAGVDGAADPDAGLVRYEPDGSLDGGFGAGGVVLVDLSGGHWDEASDVAIQSDGGIVVAVQALAGSTFDFALARFTEDGSVDADFGTAGVATTGFGAGHDYASSMLLQPDGRIVVAGQGSSDTVADFALARYEANGDLDPTFGTGGVLTVDFFGSTDGATCLVQQPDGGIVVGGVTRNGSSNELGLVRVVP